MARSLRRQLRFLQAWAAIATLAAIVVAVSAFRQAELARVRAGAPKPAQRVFVGKTRDRVASVQLADAQGRNRLALEVDADGAASLEFLDADGKVVRRVGPDGR
jgi:catechol 2,3-dioxygenase-like lactoylglutathione lyase family enzyme